MSKKLRVGTTADYPPFSFRDTQGNFEGFDLALLDLLVPSPKEIVPISWKNVTQILDANTIDLIASGITITEGRKKHGVFSKTYLMNHTVLMVPQQSKMNIKRLGVNQGGYLETVAKAKFSHLEIVPIDKNLSLSDLLLQGYYDAFLSDEIEAQRLMLKYPLEISQKFEQQSHAFIFPHRQQSLKEDLDLKLTSIITSKKYKNLVSHFGIDTNLIPSQELISTSEKKMGIRQKKGG